MDTVREIHIHTQCDSMEDLSLYGIERKKTTRKHTHLYLGFILYSRSHKIENIDDNYIAERLEIVMYSNRHERMDLPFKPLVTRSLFYSLKYPFLFIFCCNV